MDEKEQALSDFVDDFNEIGQLIRHMGQGLVESTLPLTTRTILLQVVNVIAMVFIDCQTFLALMQDIGHALKDQPEAFDPNEAWFKKEMEKSDG